MKIAVNADYGNFWKRVNNGAMHFSSSVEHTDPGLIRYIEDKQATGKFDKIHIYNIPDNISDLWFYVDGGLEELNFIWHGECWTGERYEKYLENEAKIFKKIQKRY